MILNHIDKLMLTKVNKGFLEICIYANLVKVMVLFVSSGSEINRAFFLSSPEFLCCF